jgi:hypothetical protein
MGMLVVTEFISLDGVIDDPGGSEGTEHGGWTFRFPAPEGEQFKLEERADERHAEGRRLDDTDQGDVEQHHDHLGQRPRRGRRAQGPILR